MDKIFQKQNKNILIGLKYLHLSKRIEIIMISQMKIY